MTHSRTPHKDKSDCYFIPAGEAFSPACFVMSFFSCANFAGLFSFQLLTFVCRTPLITIFVEIFTSFYKIAYFSSPLKCQSCIPDPRQLFVFGIPAVYRREKAPHLLANEANGVLLLLPGGSVNDQGFHFTVFFIKVHVLQIGGKAAGQRVFRLVGNT